MTFLAPLFLYLGLGVAGAALALHFIVTRQPPSSPLPTVRFVPRGSVRVTTVSRPRHWWLLAARMLVAILAGAAFARPVLVPDRRPVARVVLADVSRDVASLDDVRDSVRTLLGAGDALVVFDSTARVSHLGSGGADLADSLAALERSGAPARLSPALVTALRSATALRERADSVELVLVSALRAHAVDEATLVIRALWPGSIRLVRVAPADADSSPVRPDVVVSGARPDDALLVGVVAAGLSGRAGADGAVRLARGDASAADSAWAAGGRRTLVRWPADGAPPGWVGKAAPDTTGAVVAGGAAVVHRFARHHEPGPTSMQASRVVARWVDGAPAAVERGEGDGCIRDVAVPVPERGDVVLRPAFARLLRVLAAPCAQTRGSPAMGSALQAAIAGAGGPVPGHAIAAAERIATPLVPWLVAATLAMLLVEMLLRRRDPRRHATSDDAEEIVAATVPGEASGATA